MTMNLWLCLAVVCTFAQSINGAVVPGDAPAIVATVDEGDLGYDIFENDESTDEDDGQWDGTMELDPGQEQVIGIAAGVVDASHASDPVCILIVPLEADLEGGVIGFPHYLDPANNTKCHHPNGEMSEWGDCWCPDDKSLCKVARTNMASGPSTYYCFAKEAIAGVDDTWFYGSGLILDSLENPIISVGIDEARRDNSDETHDAGVGDLATDNAAVEVTEEVEIGQ